MCKGIDSNMHAMVCRVARTMVSHYEDVGLRRGEEMLGLENETPAE